MSHGSEPATGATVRQSRSDRLRVDPSARIRESLDALKSPHQEPARRASDHRGRSVA